MIGVEWRRDVDSGLERGKRGRAACALHPSHASEQSGRRSQMADIRPNGDIAIDPQNVTTPGRHATGVMETFQASWWRDNYSALDGLQSDRGYDYYDPA